MLFEWDEEKNVANQKERGRFYRGSKHLKIVVNVSARDSRFRLATASTVIFTSEHDYDSKDACLAAISSVRQDSIIAPTVFS